MGLEDHVVVLPYKKASNPMLLKDKALRLILSWR
ncbi:hypothetical protein SAMN06269250_3160 [Spirosoma fluviale]|uniref:Uncharacterized protein n=1 Tax=Spirosoma fluviale TaxID=1597977 RepID=A0A286G2J5_9BACT|nr:hypothetical protein SAMN06269250_3160 [Spirosoma fluviale]